MNKPLSSYKIQLVRKGQLSFSNVNVFKEVYYLSYTITLRFKEYECL